MSWWSRLWRGGRGAGESGAAIAGTWSVVDISGPHPFGSYTLELREDGTLAWQANVPTKEGGEFDVSGSGTWHADGTTLHYTSGEGAGTCPYSIEGGNLVLAGLPATKLSRETRCVLSSTRPKPQGVRRAYVDGGVVSPKFLGAGLISDMTVTVTPVVLGEGIPLFGKTGRDERLELVRSRAFKSGMVELEIRVRGPRAGPLTTA